MNLQQFQDDNAELWVAVQEWIREGWGCNVEITPFMVAAALEKEAATQDRCVAEGVSEASYPIHLRQLATRLAMAEIYRLCQPLVTPEDKETTEPVQDETLEWDEVENRIVDCLHKIDGEELARIHNSVCPTCPPIRYLGDSIFSL